MQPDKSEFFDNYYHVPGNERLLVNAEGRVIDLRIMASLLPSPANHEYEVVNVFGQGTVHVHRLVALVFVPCSKNRSKLQVNHKDGNKRNNGPANLEWVTASGNLLHAFECGLRSDNRPVLCRNAESGEVFRFSSLQECGLWFRIDPKVISNFIKSRPIYKFNDKYELVFEGDDWIGLDKSKVVRMNFGDRKVIAIKDGSGMVFDTPQACAYYLDLKPSKVYKQIYSRNAVLLKGYEFHFYKEYVGNSDNFIHIPGALHKRAPSRKPVPIRVEDTETGHVTDWDSAEAFGFAVGYPKNTIQKAVYKNNGIWRQYRISYIVR